MNIDIVNRFHIAWPRATPFCPSSTWCPSHPIARVSAYQTCLGNSCDRTSLDHRIWCASLRRPKPHSRSASWSHRWKQLHQEGHRGLFPGSKPQVRTLAEASRRHHKPIHHTNSPPMPPFLKALCLYYRAALHNKRRANKRRCQQLHNKGNARTTVAPVYATTPCRRLNQNGYGWMIEVIISVLLNLITWCKSLFIVVDQCVAIHVKLIINQTQ